MTILAVVIAVLVGANLLNNRYARSAYLVTSVLATAALLALFAATGLPWSAAGLDPGRLDGGLLWGAILVVAVAFAYAVAAAIPPTRRLFVDRRVVGVTGREVAYQTLVRIPFGTVALEEVAFRGVLLGIGGDLFGFAWGVALSSVLFGLWHVLPSAGMVQHNAAAGSAFRGRAALAAVAAVVFTGLAGVLFCLIVWYTGSLVPALALHWAVNALGYLTALAVTRLIIEGRR